MGRICAVMLVQGSGTGCLNSRSLFHCQRIYLGMQSVGWVGLCCIKLIQVDLDCIMSLVDGMVSG